MKNNILSFAKRYFTFEEVELLSAISDPEVQRHEFIKLWTLKVRRYIKGLIARNSNIFLNLFICPKFLILISK